MTTTELPTPRADAPRAGVARAGAHAVGAALLGAIDGVLGIALPFALYALLGVLAWGSLGTATDWTPFVRAAAVLQLLGHGVDVRFAAGGGFTVSVALLGPALVTAAAAVRSGRRAAGTASPRAAWAAGTAATALASAALLLVASSAAARPSAWQAVLLPTALAGVVGLLAMRGALPSAPPLPAVVRSGLAAAGLVLAGGAAGLGVLLLVRFPDVVALYEGLSAGPLGGLVLTLAQLLVLPVLVVWAAAWSTGAGVVLGTGSSTGALGGQVGPLPGLPLLGAVPAGGGPVAAASLLLPVLAGFAAVALARRSGVRVPALPLGATTGGIGGLVLGLLAAAASGSAGPGRFAAVGPDPLLTGMLAAVEIGLPALLAGAVLRPPADPEPVEPAQ